MIPARGSDPIAGHRFSDPDRNYMLEALALAARARYRTHPNPMVGCVLVQQGQVVGRGYHQKAGCPHAEVHALREAGAAARGATAYVTLEPCSHHGRTPPCADALIAAGVGRVVAAMADVDQRVAGRGLRRLQAAGIETQAGLCEDLARALNRPYLTLQRLGRPYVVIKAAVTLDGKIATTAGQSQWITGPEARHDVHQLRDQADAILVGVRTVLADDPQLTARCETPGDLAFGWDLPPDVAGAPALAGATDTGPWQPRSPVRVVVDSLGRVPRHARLIPAIVAVTPLAPPPRLAALREAGAEVLTYEPDGGGLVPLAPLLQDLGRRGLASLVVEGGGQVIWSTLEQGVADAARFYVAPKLVGGMQAAGPVGGPGVRRLDEAWAISHLHVRRVGPDLVLEGEITRGPG